MKSFLEYLFESTLKIDESDSISVQKKAFSDNGDLIPSNLQEWISAHFDKKNELVTTVFNAMFEYDKNNNTAYFDDMIVDIQNSSMIRINCKEKITSINRDSILFDIFLKNTTDVKYQLMKGKSGWIEAVAAKMDGKKIVFHFIKSQTNQTKNAFITEFVPALYIYLAYQNKDTKFSNTLSKLRKTDDIIEFRNNILTDELNAKIIDDNVVQEKQLNDLLHYIDENTAFSMLNLKFAEGKKMGEKALDIIKHNFASSSYTCKVAIDNTSNKRDTRDIAVEINGKEYGFSCKAGSNTTLKEFAFGTLINEYERLENKDFDFANGVRNILQSITLDKFLSDSAKTDITDLNGTINALKNGNYKNKDFYLFAAKNWSIDDTSDDTYKSLKFILEFCFDIGNDNTFMLGTDEEHMNEISYKKEALKQILSSSFTYNISSRFGNDGVVLTVSGDDDMSVDIYIRVGNGRFNTYDVAIYRPLYEFANGLLFCANVKFKINNIK